MCTSKFRRTITIAMLVCMCSVAELSDVSEKRNFVSHGAQAGDEELKSNGEARELIMDKYPFWYYGVLQHVIYISPDLQVTTVHPVGIQTDNFLNSFDNQITALKSNMDSSSGDGGKIYYRLDSSAVIRDAVNKIVRRSLFDTENFKAEAVVVVTYDKVQTADGSGINTFQIILAMENKITYVIFNYDVISGVQTYGNSGFASDDGRYYQIHPSTPTDLPLDTNTCVAGQYVYKIDGDVATDTDNCQITECIHGKCCEGLSAAKCVCDDGWTGKLCDQLDLCFVKGCVNGMCTINGAGEAKCLCAPGWTGALCNTDVCSSDLVPCFGGNCVLGSCICNTGYTGTACEIDICKRRNCQNQADCMLIALKPKCVCASGFTGVECEIDMCDGVKCQNGGQCDRSTLKCICDEGWNGTRCETSLSEGCVMGLGRPAGEAGSAQCICDEGFTGDLCDQDEDECSSGQSRCQNGRCINTVGGFVCDCDFGYDGKLCDKTAANTLRTFSMLSVFANIL